MKQEIPPHVQVRRLRRYPSDVTTDEWQIIAPFLAQRTGPGAPRIVETRAIVDAIFYRLRTGCQWRQLPADFPSWITVYRYFRKWGDDGTWERINTSLRRELRRTVGRDPEPSLGIIDSQSVKTPQVGGEHGFDGAKKNQRTETAHRG